MQLGQILLYYLHSGGSKGDAGDMPPPGVEEVVDMKGDWETYGNDLHCLWFGKVRPKKKKGSQPADNSCPLHQLRIILINYIKSLHSSLHTALIL